VAENEEISYAVKTFLAQGGKIEVVPIGLGKDLIEFNKTIESKKQAEMREEFKKKPKPSAINITIKKHINAAENKPAKSQTKKLHVLPQENRAKSGRMNIHQKPNGAWVVTVKSMHIGTYETESEAILARDNERMSLRLHEAAY
jgi:hypothetical protein